MRRAAKRTADLSNYNSGIPRWPGRGGILPLALSFFLMITPASVRAQRGAAPSPETITVDVNLVVLHVAVRDRRGVFQMGLSEKDFRVFENGKAQSIRLFQAGDLPVTVGLIVDSSSSMRRERHDVAAAAQAFVRASNPQDELFVVNFSERASLGLPATQLFSARPRELEGALDRVPEAGRTALYDAVETGLAHLKKGNRDKKVLILISDGGDNGSRRTLKQLLQDVGRSDVVIYTIGLFDEYDVDQRPGVLRKIARISGGEAYSPHQASEAVEICQWIAADIRHQYTIGYTPANGKLDNTWRTIKVTANTPDGGWLAARTRDRYLASPGRTGPPAGAPEHL